MKVKNISKLSGPMPVQDPFIIGAYHQDHYPKGNGNMGPEESLLSGKNIGNDFDRSAPWRMYHGEKVPGFPHHPHRGFEIVTIVEKGFADHFDSKGSKGRYGEGDVQLMSAGSGVLHGEMFPLLNDDRESPFELFQIWLNLPAKSKMTEPGYKMLWNENIPVRSIKNSNGASVNFKIIMGEYLGVKALDPLDNSWAKDPNHHVGIVLIEMEPGTEFTLPATSNTMNRFLFHYDGDAKISVDGYALSKGYFAELAGGEEILIMSDNQEAKLLLLEGEPIGEPVTARGPFVMNTDQELQDAYAEYRRTQFGGWPWGDTEMDMINPKDAG